MVAVMTLRRRLEFLEERAELSGPAIVVFHEFEERMPARDRATSDEFRTIGLAGVSPEVRGGTWSARRGEVGDALKDRAIGDLGLASRTIYVFLRDFGIRAEQLCVGDTHA
jgi:hypothetical protein